MIALVGIVCWLSIRESDVLMPLWVRTISNVTYGALAENQLDVLSPRFAVSRPLPVVLVFHGGRWQTGQRGDMTYTVCHRYLRSGFLVVNVEYRLGSIPAAVEDARQALRWTINAIGGYGGDPGRVVVTGVSAGAHLAMLAGFREGTAAAIVNFYGPANLGPLLESLGIRHLLPSGSRSSLAWELSPLTYVRRNTPPLFSVHGTADQTVPPEQTTLLTRAVRDVGGRASAFFIEGGRHGLTSHELDLAYERVFDFLRAQGVISR